MNNIRLQIARWSMHGSTNAADLKTALGIDIQKMMLDTVQATKNAFIEALPDLPQKALTNIIAANKTIPDEKKTALLGILQSSKIAEFYR